VVTPLCPYDNYIFLEQPDILVELMDFISMEYRVNKHKIYLTGTDDGGRTVWRLATKFPYLIAAIAPISGLKYVENVDGDLLDDRPDDFPPIWAFHNRGDKEVPLEETMEVINKIKEREADEERVKITIYESDSHDAWTDTYRNPELYQWFLK